jgi:hypothetical protein
LDNTSRENKNQIVFGYLSMLVEMEIFQKVKVGFLLFGHAHDHIDQIFKHFSVTLKRKNVGSLPSLIECIKKEYIRELVFHILEETVEMQKFIQGSRREEKCIEQHNDNRFQHQFSFKNFDGKTFIWGKQYPTTTEWGPSSSLSFLKFILDRPIFASKLLFLQSVDEIHNAQRRNRDVDYSECLEEIKKSIKDTYDYIDVVDSVWWDSFFNSQSDIISSSTNEYTMLRTPFHWPQNMSNEYEETNIFEVQKESQGAIEFTQAEKREMNIGSRISRTQCEAMKYLYTGSLQYIKEGSMIVFLVTEDPHGYPF